jgi:hypothetical protein
VRNATTARQTGVAKKQRECACYCRRLTGLTIDSVEDYPAGYPRFSALLGSHSCFRLSRKFATARERLLLVKQFRVSALERRLKEIDRCEERPLFLGSLQRDRNADRESVLNDLDNALADYGMLAVFIGSNISDTTHMMYYVEGVRISCELAGRKAILNGFRQMPSSKEVHASSI